MSGKQPSACVDDQQDIADDEQGSQNVHHRMNLFELAANHLDEGVADAAKGNAFRNAVSEGHHGDGQECGDGDFHIVPVHILHAAHHHHAHDDQHRGSGCAGDKAQEGGKENGDDKAHGSCHAGEAGAAASGNTGAGFHKGGNGGSTHDGTGGSGDGVCQHGAACVGQLAFLGQETGFSGGTVQCAHSVKHIHHGQGNQNGDQGEDGHACALFQVQQLAEALGELAEGGSKRRELAQRDGLRQTHGQAQCILHESAHDGGEDDADKQAALDVPYHQYNGDNQADNSQQHHRVGKITQSNTKNICSKFRYKRCNSFWYR